MGRECFIGVGLLGGFLLSAALITAVIATGQTFGQRCGKVYEGASLERCIMRLEAGGPLYEENIGFAPARPQGSG